MLPQSINQWGAIMTIKDFIQGAGVIAAGIAAFFSYQASQTANELNRQTHDIDKALEILWAVGQGAYDVNDPTKSDAACAFITFVAANEHRIRNEPYLARDFFSKASGKKGVSARIVESHSRMQTGQHSAPSQSMASQDLDPAEQKIPEQWYTLIATYNVTEQGCGFGERDVDDFATALSDRAFFQHGFEGLEIRTAETADGNNLVVITDAGESSATARALEAAIRDAVVKSRSSEATVERLWSGHDAIAMGNLVLSSEVKCPRTATITAP